MARYDDWCDWCGEACRVPASAHMGPDAGHALSDAAVAGMLNRGVKARDVADIVRHAQASLHAQHYQTWADLEHALGSAIRLLVASRSLKGDKAITPILKSVQEQERENSHMGGGRLDEYTSARALTHLRKAVDADAEDLRFLTILKPALFIPQQGSAPLTEAVIASQVARGVRAAAAAQLGMCLTSRDARLNANTTMWPGGKENAARLGQAYLDLDTNGQRLACEWAPTWKGSLLNLVHTVADLGTSEAEQRGGWDL